MAASLIDRYRDRLSKESFSHRTRRARTWLHKEVAKAELPANVRGNSLLRDKKRLSPQILPGRLYFYRYDPKTKDDLPYYDKFPLVLPFEFYNDGFLGLNFHYIRPHARVILMNKLYETLNNRNFDETTKISVSYDLLKNASRFKEFKPCLKRYLLNHIRSRFIQIESHDWEIALMLPVDEFVKAKKTKVWRDSRKMY
jgi:hypothetical protein